MSKRDGEDAAVAEPIRVETRDEFDEAVTELFRTGRPIEAPSLGEARRLGRGPRRRRGRHRGGAVMAKGRERADEYHQQFAERIIKLLI